MIEAKEAAKIKKYMYGQYTRIENSVSFGMPDALLSGYMRNQLLEHKVVHGKRDHYFWLEKSQRIWHLKHLEAKCECRFIFFQEEYISILNSRFVPGAEMEWNKSKKKWKVPFYQFKDELITYKRRHVDWTQFNQQLWE